MTEGEAQESHEQSGKAWKNRAHVEALLKAFPWLTSAELAKRSHLDKHEVRRRLTDLLNNCKAVQGEPRICSVAGTRAVTWKRT